MRETQDPEITQEPDGVVETHPAFGTASVVRSHGSGTVLFQSDLVHSDTVILSINRTERKRALNQDWLLNRDEIIQIEMSAAQWGQLVSSVGIGSGTPVTIRRVNKQAMPELPHRTRIAENLEEVKSAIDRLTARVTERYTELASAITDKKGIREIREALRQLELAIAGMKSNAVFAVQSMDGAAEKIVAQATADIETKILQAQRLVAGAPQENSPTLDARDYSVLPELTQKDSPEA